MESTKVVEESTVAPPALSSARTAACAGQATPAVVLARSGHAAFSSSITFSEARPACWATRLAAWRLARRSPA